MEIRSHRHVVLAPFVGSAAAPWAGHQFLHQYLNALADAGWDVHLVAPDNLDNQRELNRGDSRYAVTLVAGDPLWPRLRRRIYRETLGWVEGLTTVFHEPNLRAIDYLLRGAAGIEIHWGEALPSRREIARLRRQAPVAFFCHDLRQDLRAQIARDHLPLVRGLVSRVALAHAARQETRRMQVCDLVLAFKKNDLRMISAQNRRVVRPWLDIPHGAVDVEKSPPKLLFVGALDRPENEESIMWFLERVWPQLRERIPAVELTVVGGSPSGKLLALSSELGFAVPGYVEDLEPHYRQARCVIAPIVRGVGVKFKVPQAMAYGLPVAATELAANGVGAPTDAYACISDDPRVWISALEAQLQNPLAAVAAGRAARDWVMQSGDFAHEVQSVMGLWSHDEDWVP